MIGNCASVTATSCKVTLIATDDGGASWHVLDVPPGLHSMFSTTVPDGSCASQSDILGPCVGNVLFADDHNGYLFGQHGFYWTSDGGHTWHDAPNPAAGSINSVPAMVAADGFAYRLFAAAPGGSTGDSGRLQRAPLGTNDWTDISPADMGIFSSQIAATGSALYVDAGGYGSNATTQVYRSTDHGDHWQPIGPAPHALLSGVAVAPDGAVALSTSNCHFFVSADGTLVPPAHHAAQLRPRLRTSPESSSPTDLTLIENDTSGETSPVRLYHSSDGGASFQRAARFTTPGAHWTTFGMLGDFGYLTVTGDQFYLTFDGGRTWQSRSFSN